MENRAAKFRLWLEQVGGFCHIGEIRTLTHPQATGLLATYIHHLSVSPYNTAGHFRMANTLTHHLAAAHAFLAQHMIQPLPLYSHTSGGHRIIPFLGAFIYVILQVFSPDVLGALGVALSDLWLACMAVGVADAALAMRVRGDLVQRVLPEPD